MRGLPSPFEAVMGQVSHRSAMPGDDEVEGGLILRRRCHGFLQQISLGCFAFAVPFIFASERPGSVSSTVRTSVFLKKAGGNRCAHVCVDGSRMLAAQAEGFEEALAYGRNRNPKFTQPVVNRGLPDGGMRRGFV